MINLFLFGGTFFKTTSCGGLLPNNPANSSVNRKKIIPFRKKTKNDFIALYARSKIYKKKCRKMEPLSA